MEKPVLVIFFLSISKFDAFIGGGGGRGIFRERVKKK